jgi:hypothetical protein
MGAHAGGDPHGDEGRAQLEDGGDRAVGREPQRAAAGEVEGPRRGGGALPERAQEGAELAALARERVDLEAGGGQAEGELAGALEGVGFMSLAVSASAVITASISTRRFAEISFLAMR